MSKRAMWTRAISVAILVMVIAAISVSAAPNLPLIPKFAAGSEEFVPVSRGIDGPEFVEGEVLVELKPMLTMSGATDVNAAEAALGAFNATMGAEVVESMSIGADSTVYVVKIPSSMTVEDAVLAYSSKKFVECAEPNYLWYTDAPVLPDDPHFWRTWGMRNYGQDFYPGLFWEKGMPGCDIGAAEAWNVRTDASSVLLAVIDSGIDVNHVDLVNNMWLNEAELNGQPGVDDDENGFIDDINGWDFANNDNSVFDGRAYDSHGTHCAGTIGAEGNNGKGVAGVAWDAQIMSLKFIHGRSGPTTGAIKAINYAKAKGAKIASNSWGGGGYSELLEKAIAESGMLFIAAAGNSSDNNDLTPHYPSSYDLPNIIAVAASDWNDNLANFSCYGAESVDLAAPGHWIISAYAEGGYAWMGGTSMATPHVSGAAVLVAAEYPDIPLYPGAEGYEEGDLTIKDILLRSVDQNPSFEGKMTTGGRLNVANAINLKFPTRITSASATETFGAAPLATTFTATVANPTDIASAWWSLGDGSPDIEGLTATYTYENEGAYLACFHVMNTEGVESKWPVQVVVANPGTIVYVDDDGGFGFEDYFIDSCMQAGFECVVVDSRFPLGLSDNFTDRPLVWNTTFSWSDTILMDQEEFLSSFMDNGGRLLMISPNYLYDNGLTPFAQRYLHVAAYEDDVAMDPWYGVEGDVITDGLVLNANYSLGQEDGLFPEYNARPILEGENPNALPWPALRYADEVYRLVFTTVPWEELPIREEGVNEDPNNSTYLLTKIVDYLMGDINIKPTIDSANINLGFARTGEEVTFTAAAHDVNDENEVLEYVWEIIDENGGLVTALEGPVVKYTFETVGAYDVYLIVMDQGMEYSVETLSVVAAGPDAVVFVDDDDSDGDTEQYFIDAFSAIEQDFVRITPVYVVGSNGAKAGLERFRVVWNCGELGGLDDDEQKAVADFLDKRGRLFLAGQEVMFQLAYASTNGMEFARNYLHISDVEHDVGTAYVTGVEGNPITDGVRVDLLFPAGFDDWTDGLTLAPDAQPLFMNDADKPCALVYVGDDHRVVFMAVAFEAFPLAVPVAESVGARADGPVFDAAALLFGSIEWITKPIVTVTKPLAGQVCTGPTAIGWTAVDFEDEDLSVKIEYSMDDGATWTQVAAGEQNDGAYVWDVATLDHGGQYMIRITATRPDEISDNDVSKAFVVSAVGPNRLAAGPNPASSSMNFYANVSGEATLFIYDIAGRQVFSQKFENGENYFVWDLVDNAGKPLANGLYLCYMLTADGAKTDVMRLVVNR